MPNSSGEPKPTEAQDETSNSENLDQAGSQHIPEDMDPAGQDSATDSEGAVQSEDWWQASPPVAEWAKPDNASFTPDAEVDPSKASATAFLRAHELVSLESRTSSDCQRGTNRRTAGILGPGTNRTFGKGRHDCFCHRSRSRSVLPGDARRSR